jgi:hypothetical protein
MGGWRDDKAARRECRQQRGFDHEQSGQRGPPIAFDEVSEQSGGGDRGREERNHQQPRDEGVQRMDDAGAQHREVAGDMGGEQAAERDITADIDEPTYEAENGRVQTHAHGAGKIAGRTLARHRGGNGPRARRFARHPPAGASVRPRRLRSWR